jgi:penicillin-binding protein 1A
MHPALQRRRRHLMMTRRTTRRGSQRRGLATFLLVTLGVFALTFVGSIMGTAGGMFAAYNYFASGLPEPDILDEIIPAESTYVYDRSGQHLLARFECQNREAVEFEQLPDTIWQATIASEDRTFWENNGVDFQGTVRAALANLEAGEIVQGASTITQQVIDYARVLKEEGASTQVDPDATAAPSIDPANPDAPAAETEEGAAEEESDVCQPPAPSQSTDFQDKIRENILAMQVTSAYPGREGKELILETYLNLIYYGNGSYGIAAAAANYFGLSDLSQMTVAQAAFLAALPQQPSVLDPYQNPKYDPENPEAVHHPGGVQRGAQHLVGRHEPEPHRLHPRRAAVQLPGARGGGPHPGPAGRRGPGGGRSDGRVSDHDLARLRPPAGGEAPREGARVQPQHEPGRGPGLPHAAG